VDAIKDDAEDEEGSESEEEEDEEEVEEEDEVVEDSKVGPAGADVKDAEGGDESESGDEQKPVGNSMNALIKAAAIWLTKDDQNKDGGSAARTSSRGRALPGKKRGAEKSPARNSKSTDNDDGDASGTRGSSLTSGKRRRVHF
jgi:hypothetical protein